MSPMSLQISLRYLTPPVSVPQHVQRYMRSGQIRQRLSEFAEATGRPRRWLERAETLLAAPLACQQPQLADRRREIQVRMKAGTGRGGVGWDWTGGKEVEYKISWGRLPQCHIK